MSKWYSSSKKRGTTGGNTYSIVNGQTIEREKAVSVKNPRTALQMSQRVKWANLIFFWTLSGEAMLKGFINKKRNQSWFNAFMSLNLGQPGTFLTKQEADAKTCIAAPYYVARGPLSPVPFVYDDNTAIIINVEVGSTEPTTLGALSSLFVNQLNGFQNGDKICVINAVKDNATSSIIRAIEKFEFVLNTESSSSLPSFVNIPGSGTSQDPFILKFKLDGGIGDGCNSVAVVHTRKVANKVQTSTAKMLISGTAGDDHRTDAYKAQAIASYETEPAVFYDPDAE